MSGRRVDVVGYSDALAADFARLNYAWIERYFSIEEEDTKVLSDPRAHILDPGGEIFFVLVDDQVVGTVAMTPHAPGVFELAKMAVDPQWQGLGLGRRLMDACIGFAQQRGAREIMLVTNDRLDAALGLYRSAGFEKSAIYTDRRYARGNLEMRRRLDPLTQPPRDGVAEAGIE